MTEPMSHGRRKEIRAALGNASTHLRGIDSSTLDGHGPDFHRLALAVEQIFKAVKGLADEIEAAAPTKPKPARRAYRFRGDVMSAPHDEPQY